MHSGSLPETKPAEPAAPPERRASRAQRFFFGDDVFVSYARRDSDYALALADALTRAGLSCFLDQWGTPPGVELPVEVVERVRKASMLVLVGTESAARSENVMKEVVEFKRTGRPIIPITFVSEDDYLKVRNNQIPEGLRGSLEEATWYREIAGVALTVESKARLKAADPRAGIELSTTLVTRITNAEGFVSRSRRLRKTFWTTLTALAALLAAGALVTWVFINEAYAQVDEAQAARKKAVAEEQQAKSIRDEAERQKVQALKDLDAAKGLTERAQQDLKTAQGELAQAASDLLAANEKTRAEQERAERARREAERQGRLAESQMLAASAVTHLETDPEQSALIAREAYAVAPTEQAGSVLRRSLLRSSVIDVVEGEDPSRGAPVLDETGEYVVSGRADGEWQVRRAATGEVVRRLPPAAGRYPGPAFSPDGRYVYATADDDRKEAVQIWEWAADLSPSNPRVLSDAERPTAAAPPHCVLDKCSISSPAFSADGRYLAAASRRGWVWVWDLRGDAPPSRLELGTTGLSLLSFSPGEGRRLLFSEQRYSNTKSGLTNEDDEHLLLWEWGAARGPDNPRALRQPGHVEAAVFDPTGRYVAAAVNREEREVNPEQPEGYREGEEDRTAPASHLVRVHDLLGGRVLTLGGHLAPVSDVSFSPDGKYLLTASYDTTARVHNWMNPRARRHPVVLKHGDSIVTASFDRSGEYVVTSGRSSAPRLWRPGFGREVAESNRLSLDSPPVAVLRGHNGYVTARFSSDGRRVLTTGSDDKTARVWRADAGRVKAALVRNEGHLPRLTGAALSPDGRHLAAADWSGQPIRVWRVEDGADETEVGVGGDVSYGHLSFSPDGRLILASTYAEGEDDSVVRAWEWQDGTRRGRPRAIDGRAGSIAGIAVSRHEAGAAYVMVARSPRNRGVIVPGAAEHFARVWRLDAAEGGPPAAELRHAQPVTAAAFSPDRESRYLATVSGTEVLIFAWAESGRPVRTLRSDVPRHFKDVAFSPDGHYVAAVGLFGAAMIWDLREPEGAAPRVLVRPGPSANGFALHFNTVAFSPDGRLVLTTDSDETARLWEIRTGESLQVIGEGRRASFSRDGSLVLASSEQAARVYECPECRSEETLCALVADRVSRRAARGRAAARPCPVEPRGERAGKEREGVTPGRGRT